VARNPKIDAQRLRIYAFTGLRVPVGTVAEENP
jgi:hypothetical protein